MAAVLPKMIDFSAEFFFLSATLQIQVRKRRLGGFNINANDRFEVFVFCDDLLGRVRDRGAQKRPQHTQSFHVYITNHVFLFEPFGFHDRFEPGFERALGCAERGDPAGMSCGRLMSAHFRAFTGALAFSEGSSTK